MHFQLNDAFTLYKKEKAENDRMLNDTNDRLQRQLTELRSSHAKLTSQLEFSNKRCGKITKWSCDRSESLDSLLWSFYS